MKFRYILLILAVFTACSKDKAPEARFIDPVTVEFKFAELNPGPGLTMMEPEHFSDTLYVHQEVLLSQADFDSIEARIGTIGPELIVYMSGEAKERWARITGENVGRLVAMIVDGRLITTPKIMRAIDEGRALIRGGFTEEEIAVIAESVNAALEKSR